MTNLLTKCLITDITAICALASTRGVLSCESVKWMTLHTPQEHGSSPLCISWCAEKLIFKVNVLLHTSQQYGRSPLCKRLCDIRLLFRVNTLLHTSQQYGRSPLCKRLCIISSPFWMNALLHTSQQYGHSPVCKSLCLIRALFMLNVLLHTSQQYGLSRLCMHWCFIISLFWMNALLHGLHEYRCSLVCAWSCSFQVPCQKHKDYTLGYFLIQRTSILHAMCELAKKLLVLKSCIFEAKHCISTHHKTLNVSNDSSEWQYCCWGAWTFTKSCSNHKNIGVRTLTYGKFQTQVP